MKSWCLQSKFTTRGTSTTLVSDGFRGHGSSDVEDPGVGGHRSREGLEEGVGGRCVCVWCVRHELIHSLQN